MKHRYRSHDELGPACNRCFNHLAREFSSHPRANSPSDLHTLSHPFRTPVIDGIEGSYKKPQKYPIHFKDMTASFQPSENSNLSKVCSNVLRAQHTHSCCSLREVRCTLQLSCWPLYFQIPWRLQQYTVKLVFCLYGYRLTTPPGTKSSLGAHGCCLRPNGFRCQDQRPATGNLSRRHDIGYSSRLFPLVFQPKDASPSAAAVVARPKTSNPSRTDAPKGKGNGRQPKVCIDEWSGVVLD